MEPLKDKHYTLPASELSDCVQDARTRTLALVADLEDSQLEVPAMGLVNPFRWELGHVAFFYEAFLLQLLDQTPPLIEHGNDWFNSFEIDHGDRWSLPLPDREGMLAYMERVFAKVVERLHSKEPDAIETYVYLLSVMHEDMHGEAFTWMRQTLQYPVPVLETPAEPLPAVESIAGDVDIPGGSYQLGALPQAPFVFDNEKWAFVVEVKPFRIARTCVTNGEFREFVEAGGYSRQEFWSTQGWRWRSKHGRQHPIYWARGENNWLMRHFNQWIALREKAPVVHVNWYEAQAYCQWAHRRLPTEAEWDLAASAQPTADGKGILEIKRRYPWGNEPPSPEKTNLDSRYLGCVDVSAFPQGDSAFGCRQMLGNVWEWTETPFYPFPGYLVDFPYVEYSAPWFGYPKVLKGGAWATRSRLAYNAYRNFFPPQRNDIFCGFRTCAKD